MLKIKKVLFLFLFLLSIASMSQSVTFIPNQGQYESNVLFKAAIPGGVMFVEKTGLTYSFYEAAAFEKYHATRDPQTTVKIHSFKVWFEGASDWNVSETFEPTKEYYNYFIGNNPSLWAAGVYGAHKIKLINVYPNIDLEIFSTEGRFLKYNFIVHPGGNIASIQLRYEGVDVLDINHGSLEIPTSLGVIHEDAPISFQEGVVVSSKFILQKQKVSFNISQYNKSKDLIIDPKVVFSTFSGSLADNWGFTGTYDNSGNGYSGGTVYDFGFPVTLGAVQKFFKNGIDVNGSVGELARDAGILKYSSDGTQLLFCTYLGGHHNEQPHSMVVNSKGELLILGTTWSTDFPVVSNGFSTTLGGMSDIYVVKLSSDGKILLASTFIGGPQRDGLNGNIDNGFINNPSKIYYNYGDIFRGEINVDGNDNVYFASCTESSTGFPIVNGFQPAFGGGLQDGCIFKLNSTLNQVLWSTYVGGNIHDAAYGICFDRNNNLFVVGGTDSYGLSFNVNGNRGSSYGGRADGFLLKLNSTTGSLINSTYVGTSTFDETYFVQTDSTGNVYVAGQTDGSVPIIPSTIYNQPNTNQFIQVFDNSLNSLKRSMSFGNARSAKMSLSAFLVDKCNHVFISGWGGADNQGSLGGPGGNVKGMPLTNDAFQKTTDGSDFYIAIFSKDINTLLFATYFGGDGIDEHDDGGTSRFDREGIIYQSVCGGCGGQSQFPTTPGAWSRTNRSTNCNNALFKIDFENLNRAPIVEDSSYTVNFLDTLKFNYKTFDPDFDDSIYTTFSVAKSPSGKLMSPISGNATVAGVGSSLAQFKYFPGCSHKNDSFYIQVIVRDVGCPAIRTDTANIKIKVLPPTVPDPPKMMCMTFVNNHTVKLRWDSFNLDRYFKYYLLYKTDGNGTRVVDTMRAGTIQEYYDSAAFNYDVKNICYKIIGYNICNEPGTASYDVCSIREFNIPIDSTYMYTATVVDNKNIKVTWLRSKEKDFAAYQIYRRVTIGNKSQPFVLYKSFLSVLDTTFIDEAVDVQNNEYCYNVKVADACGHISHFTNQSCNIILKGNAVPFEHQLAWTKYKDWYQEVNRYELFRFDDRKFITNETITPSNLRTYIDKNLDYDWGGYWYYVVAHQNDSNFKATSQSNTVYVYQPPLLWVPNAFSSNNDGINDTWGIVPVFVREYNMKVYNRWGQLVFETDNKKNDWNGDYKGRTPFDEVLIWIVTYTGWDDRVYYKKGTVTILN